MTANGNFESDTLVTKPGDSGGPVYIDNPVGGVTAVGIVGYGIVCTTRNAAGECTSLAGLGALPIATALSGTLNSLLTTSFSSVYANLPTPTRVYDSRNSGRVNGTVPINIPSNLGGATSPMADVVVNITAVDAAGAGFVNAYPYGSTIPVGSALNYTTVGAIAQLVTVPVTYVNGAGYISVRTSSLANVIVDVTTWLREPKAVLVCSPA